MQACALALAWLLSASNPQHWDRPHAVAVVANLWAESHCDPNSSSNGQLGGPRWQGPRLARVLAESSRLGVAWSDLDFQLRFLVAEWAGMRGYERWLRETDLARLTYAFCREYERPRGSCRRGGIAKRMMEELP